MPPAKVEPGRDPGMADRTRKLNVLFALTSIAMLIVFSWMIWADYDREWKQHQIAFTDMEVKRTEEDIQKALGKVDAKRKQELDAKLAQGGQEAKARQKEIEQAQGDLNKIDGEWYRVDQDYRFTKAKIDVARYNYEETLETKHGNADKRKKDLDGLEKRWSELRVQLQDV